MGPEIEKKRRELYESRVVLPDSVRWNEGTKSYTGANFWLAQFGWDAFNAALDAVEIELPSNRDVNHDKAAISAIDSCRQSIKATGLGLKVK